MRNSVKDIKYLMQSVRSVRYDEITLEITSIIHIYFNLVLTFLDLNGQEAARTSIGKIIIWGRYVGRQQLPRIQMVYRRDVQSQTRFRVRVRVSVPSGASHLCKWFESKVTPSKWKVFVLSIWAAKVKCWRPDYCPLSDYWKKSLSTSNRNGTSLFDVRLLTPQQHLSVETRRLIN